MQRPRRKHIYYKTAHINFKSAQVTWVKEFFSKLMALLNYLCVSSISLAVQRRTPLEIRQKHSRILLYMHRFRIVSSVNSWVARLLCLPPMFRFVRLGVQRENHCDCASSSHGQAPQWRKNWTLEKKKVLLSCFNMTHPISKLGPLRQTIYNPARRHSTCHLTFYSQLLPKSLGGS